jgi:flavin reductase
MVPLYRPIADFQEGRTGMPILANASVNFECEFTNSIDEATHRIFFGRVVDIRESGEQATLLYCTLLHGSPISARTCAL